MGPTRVSPRGCGQPPSTWAGPEQSRRPGHGDAGGSVGGARIEVIAMELAFAVPAQCGTVAVTACPWRARSPDGSLDVLRRPSAGAPSGPG
jgi:hypothetical protein